MEEGYENGKIYKILCKITNEIYIGSTKNTLEERLRLHIYDTHCKSKQIIDRGDYDMILIKDYPCNSKEELEEEEKKYILENDCINVKIPHRTKAEWYIDNKKKVLEQQKQYREEYREEINKKKAEKITCECGCIVRMGGMTNHRRTKKHINLMNKI
jgi:hypothetical protein